MIMLVYFLINVERRTNKTSRSTCFRFQVSDVRQFSMFDKGDTEKLQALDRAVDKIREKYGRDPSSGEDLQTVILMPSRVERMIAILL